jgi:hypothetical protein
MYALVAEVLCRHITWPTHIMVAFVKSWPYFTDHLVSGIAACPGGGGVFLLVARLLWHQTSLCGISAHQ